jgi:site-specific recombinase XerD
MNQKTLLEDASEIASAMYEAASTIEITDLDEKWRTVSKLKSAAIDAYFYVAQIAGAGESQSTEFDCMSAKKYLSTIKSLYVFASKQHLIDLDPSLVVQIDNAIETISSELVASEQERTRRSEADMAPWLEKYRIWQKIQ